MSEDRATTGPDAAAGAEPEGEVPYRASTGPAGRPVGAGGSVRTGKSSSGEATDDAATDALATTGGVTATGAAASGGAASGAGSRAVGEPLGRSPGRPARFDPRPAPPARPASKRRARLAVSRVDPWSVFVLSLLISLFLGVVLIVAVFVLYSVLDSLGVLSSVTTFAQDLQIISAGQSLVSMGRVLGVAAVLAAVDVVLLTALATFAAFLYNICASLTGGIEVVLAERD